MDLCVRSARPTLQRYDPNDDTTPPVDPTDLPWWRRRLVAFDTETTGLDPENDRIVTAAIVDISAEQPDGRRHINEWSIVIDPGIDIPDEAAKIHGWTTEKLRNHPGTAAPEPGLRAIVAQLHTAMLGIGDNGQAEPPATLVVMNAAYDLTILDRDCRRHRVCPLVDELADGIDGRRIPMVIDRHIDRYRPGRRTLGALCQTYGVTLDTAHNERADARAAARVAWRLGQMCGDWSTDRLLRHFTGRRRPSDLVGVFRLLGAMTVDQLHDAQVGWAAAWADNFAAYLRRELADLVHRRDNGPMATASSSLDDDIAALEARIDGVRGEWPYVPWKEA